MNATRRKWKSNLHKIRILDKRGKICKIYVSARALKKNEFRRV
ncbi:ribosomal L28 family protein [Candidatus Phytoplasma oryzae]|nr:ribosomal L28 family protein [Candidatus Phytoplasma oryzae]